MLLTQFKVGNRLDRQEVILWVQKTSQSANGSWFIRGTMEDRSGSLGFICFNNESVERVKELTSAVPAVVSGHIQVDKYGSDGRLQILADVIELLPPGHDASHLLPVTRKDTVDYRRRFEALIESVESKPVRELLSLAFSGSRLEQFSKNPAAKRYHHAYIGGLLEHSVDVAELASAIAKTVPGADIDKVIAGALLHDIGKIAEISSEIGFAYTISGHLVGHITLGALMIESVARQVEDLPAEYLQEILHIVLSHHGSREKGSPVGCATREAFVVHYADELNAVLQQFVQPAETNGTASDWVFNRMTQSWIKTGSSDS